MVTIFLWKELKIKKRLADGYRTFARRKGLRRDKLRLKGASHSTDTEAISVSLLFFLARGATHAAGVSDH